MRNEPFKHSNKQNRNSLPHKSFLLALALSVATLGMPAFAHADEFSAPKNVSAVAVSNEIQVTWGACANATGYELYRKIGEEGTWKHYKTISVAGKHSYDDAKTYNGTPVFYKVTAIYASGTSAESETTTALWLEPPSSLETTWDTAQNCVVATWTQNESASSYQLQYSTNRLFTNVASTNFAPEQTGGVEGETEQQGASKASDTTVTLSTPLQGANKGATYYYRVRACSNSEGKTVFSDWCYTSATTSLYASKLTALKARKGNKRLEVRTASKQKINKFDTLQGTCSDGTYVYFVLLKKSTETCKIVKMRLSNRKIVKISKALKIGHGNDVTYNSILKRLVVANCRVKPFVLTLINPKTLKITKTKTIRVTASLPGCSTTTANNTTGISSIAYNATRKQYIALLKGSGEFLLLDASLNPVRVVTMSYHDPRQNQALEATDQYILSIESPGNGLGANVVNVYNWDGVYVRTVRLSYAYEAESLFLAKGRFYAGFYAYAGKSGRKGFVYKISSL